MDHMNITESEDDIPIEYYFLLIPVGFALVCIGFIRHKTRQCMDNH